MFSLLWVYQYLKAANGLLGPTRFADVRVSDPQTGLHFQVLKVVREGRLELPICCQSWILSPVRLPISPLSHGNMHLDFKFKTIKLSI